MKSVLAFIVMTGVLAGTVLSCSSGGGGGGGGGGGETGPTAPPTTAALKVNDGSARATFRNMKAAFNNAGKGIVVWEEVTGTGSRVLRAYFNGTNMLPEVELARYAEQPSVATNGTDFMLIWNTSGIGTIFAAPCSSIGELGTPVEISNANSQLPDIAASKEGYVVAWLGYDAGTSQYRIFTNIYSASSWTTPQRIDVGSGASSEPPRVASNGSGYAVAWQKHDDITGQYDVYGAISSGSTATATWQAALLENLDRFAYPPSIISNGDGYAVAWTQHDGSALSGYANIYSSGSWSTGGTLLENSLNEVGPEVSVASNGSGYAAAWYQNDGTNFSAYTNIYSGGSWSAAVQVDASPNYVTHVTIASNGSGYAVAWLQVDGAGQDAVLSNLYSGASWTAPVLLNTGTADARQPLTMRFPTGYAVAWFQDDSLGKPNMYERFYDGGVWSASPMPVVQNAWKGTAYAPKMATNRSGVSLAVWPEYHKGARRIVGSINASGTWGAPRLIDDDTAGEAAVSTDGTSFMIVWFTYTQYAPMAVTCASDGTLGTPQRLAPSSGYYGYDFSIASNGSGYAAVWSQYDGAVANSVYANVYSSGSWSKDGGGNPTPWTIENGSTYAFSPRVASNGSGYGAAWLQYNGAANDVYANIFSSGTWSAGGTLLETGAFDAERPSIASNGSGYAVAWHQNDGVANNVYANIYSASTWSSGGTLLEDSDRSIAFPPSIASNGSGYAVAWMQYDGTADSVYANIYSGGTWSTSGTLLEDSSQNAFNPPGIASDGSGYAVSWTQHDGSYFRVHANLYSSGTWSTGGTLLETNNGNADAARIISNGNKYSVIWMQQDPADSMVYDVWARLGVF